MTTRRKIPFKVAVWLPLIVVPVAAALFYGLGGGQPEVPKSIEPTGLNTSLPSTLPSDQRPLDKLSIYQLAEADSLKRLREEEKDPLYQQSIHDSGTTPAVTDPGMSLSRPTAIRGVVQTSDPYEQKVHARLKVLEQEMERGNNPTPSTAAENTPNLSLGTQPPEASTATPTETPDPEMEQINAMLEKVLDVQHPERVRDKLKTASVQDKSRIFPVANVPPRPVTDALFATDSSYPLLAATRFYEWNDSKAEAPVTNTVKAVIHETKTVVSGATIKIRLEQDLYCQGTLIPAGTFVFGKGTLNGDRFTIGIRDIRYQTAVFPVSLEVVGLDGIPGIFIEGAISREVMRSSTDQSMQGLQLATADPSLGAQAAAATLETAKSIFSRKIRLTNVTLKAGEPVLLRDTNQQ